MDITCPDCRAVMETDASPGNVIECPRCKGEITVPSLPIRGMRQNATTPSPRHDPAALAELVKIRKAVSDIRTIVVWSAIVGFIAWLLGLVF